MNVCHTPGRWQNGAAKTFMDRENETNLLTSFQRRDNIFARQIRKRRHERCLEVWLTLIYVPERYNALYICVKEGEVSSTNARHSHKFAIMQMPRSHPESTWPSSRYPTLCRCFYRRVTATTENYAPFQMLRYQSGCRPGRIHDSDLPMFPSSFR